MLHRLCIYCGSNSGSLPEFTKAAQECGTQIARHHIGLVYGGGNVGLMGVLADSVLAAGGEVIGVIPQYLANKELAHPAATEMHRVDTMHERKQLMAHLSDGFIVLPGGIGTLEEMFETLTWLQLGLHNKPIGLLNVAGFFTPMLEFLDTMVIRRFLKQEHRELLLVENEIQALLPRMSVFKAPNAHKWLDTVAREDLR